MDIEKTFQEALGFYRGGDLAKAEGLLRRVLATEPRHGDALRYLGLVAASVKKHGAARDLLLRAIALNPAVAEYHFDLGTFLETLGQLNEAIAEYGKAISLRQDYADAWFNLGIARHRTGDLQEALRCYQQAVELRPGWFQVYNNVGLVLNDLGRRSGAIAAFKQCLALNPNQPEVLMNLGDAYYVDGELDPTIECYSRAVKLRDGFARAHTVLANAYRMSGQLAAAHDSYEAAVVRAPEDAGIASARLFLQLLHPAYDSAAQLRELRNWDRRFGKGSGGAAEWHDNEPDPDRRLRIGLVSADFRIHVVSFNLLPLLREYDRSQFEIICYSNIARPDAMTELMRSHAAGWRDIHQLNEAGFAELIRSDGIDILVDLALHSGGNRLQAFGYKPAPVQVAFAGYPGGTGVGAMDWRLSDPHLDPPGESDGDYVERTYRLPESFWCYDPTAMTWGMEAPPEVGELPAMRNGYVTFGCLNNFSKVNDEVLALWAQVMNAVPSSRLLAMVPVGSSRERVLAKLASHGVSGDRVEFVTYQKRSVYLTEFHRIDLGLDTFPYNGHTASLDSAWMGVPVVTRVGKTVVGRAGVSQLRNLGLSELIARDDEEFVRIASEWAGDLQRLAEMRRTLRQRMLDSPLADAKRFTGNIQDAWRQIWKEWCGGRRTATAISAKELFDRAMRHQQTGRLDRAMGLYRRVLAIQPDDTKALNNLGVALTAEKKWEEAAVCFGRVVDLQPDAVQGQLNLGGALAELGKFEEAIAHFRRALALKPNDVDALNNLGNIFKDTGRIGEAMECYQKAMQANPGHVQVSSNWVYAHHFDPGSDAEAILREQRAWNQRHAAALGRSIRPHGNDRSPERRLKIGYVSADFRGHVVGWNVLPLLREHDHQRFEIFCYSNVARPDQVTQRMAKYADGWRNIVGLSDQQAADLIRADGIDILVDLSLHTSDHRLLVFAQKPAPVQVTFAGYPGGTGVSAIDWRLTDPYLDPPGETDGEYVERSYRLADSFWCYDPEAMAPEGELLSVGPLPALKNGFITFGCLNNFCKVNGPVMDLWAKVLKKVDHSGLVLRYPEGESRQRIIRHFEGAGVEAERIEILGFRPRREYFESYGRIDIALDTFPYNGHTTSLDAMWMGVPVVTMAGKTVVGRAGVSQLNNLGMTELIARTEEEYIRIAAELAGDLPGLEKLRKNLRSRMLASPLTDAKRFARNIESAYRQMWRDWCEQRPR